MKKIVRCKENTRRRFPNGENYHEYSVRKVVRRTSQWHDCKLHEWIKSHSSRGIRSGILNNWPNVDVAMEAVDCSLFDIQSSRPSESSKLKTQNKEKWNEMRIRRMNISPFDAIDCDDAMNCSLLSQTLYVYRHTCVNYLSTSCQIQPRRSSLLFLFPTQISFRFLRSSRFT